jgi:superfamily I DNA and/or RNA helicase/very-short-patch-repair endonuclease
MESIGVKKLIKNLFTYVKEIKSRLELPILDESKYEWKQSLGDLPDHPYIFRNPTDQYFLKVKRPKAVECPLPPVEIQEWIKPSWKYIDKELSYLKSKNLINEDESTTTVHIEELPDILAKIGLFKKVRDGWREAELPSEGVRKIFSHLHEVKARIEKDSEGIQLYLTEGQLTFENKTVVINHPLLYKEISIELDGEKDEPEILITKSSNNSSIFISLLRALEVSGSTLNSLKDEFFQIDIDPDDDKAELFLKSLVHKLWKDGTFSDVKVTPSEKPTVFLSQKLILGRKESSFTEQIDNYIKRIDSLDELPMAYQNMVGHFEEDKFLPPELPSSDMSIQSNKTSLPKKRDYFLTKEYNTEQKKIINLLEDNGCVSVQGPPGTGKSHTIANLIGHLLAKGQSVLVSSQRSKALEVIRDQVVEDIRSLCVSILDNQTNNKDELQKAVNFLEELLSKNDIEQVSREVDELTGKRETLIEEIEGLEKDYMKCILNEYTPISYQGESVLPKDAAIYISENPKCFIPGPFSSDISPINEQILGELKSIIRTLTVSDQKTIANQIPALDELLNIKDFETILNENITLEKSLMELSPDNVNLLRSIPVEKLQGIVSNIIKIRNESEACEDYLRAMMDFMLKGEQYVSTFQQFVDETNKQLLEIESYGHLIFEHDPKLESEHDLEALIKCAENIHDTSDKQVKFSFFAKLFSNEMKIIKNEATIQGRELRTKNEALSIVHLLKVKRTREQISEKWNNLASSRLGALKSSEFNKDVELEVSYRLKGFEGCLELKAIMDNVIDELKAIGISIPSKGYEEVKFRDESLHQDLNCHLEEFNNLFMKTALVVIEEHRVMGLTEKYKFSLETCKKYSGNSDVNDMIYQSLLSKDLLGYKKSYSELRRLTDYVDMNSRLEEICSGIRSTAPSFSEQLLNRSLDEEVISVDSATNLWRSSYLEYVINERNKISPMVIQDKLTTFKKRLKSLDSALIQKLAVGNQLRRITPRQRQALRGFVVAQNKMTKNGKGVRDAHLRKEAKVQMKECSGAVPVWIMPLSKVMDNFVIGEDSFDVLIIDEASQADITNLPIFSMAKKVIVVGDDKQVSPAAAGVKLAGVDELINEFLEGIPNKAIYDYKASLYDIACSSFGETIRLTEHFRCTPEIIQFCNDLQYQGNIKPLRESNSNPTPPSLVPFYVDGFMDESKRNMDEAITIAAIIAAMTTFDKYKDTSIGVISLFGNMQHQLIDSLLRSTLSTVEYERHRIVCGKSPQFQGDERNIIFLTMVESPNPEGPMRKKSETDTLKKEYNVAVSRAQDQLWIMHSMNKDIHLQPDDIRLKLLKHASDPRDLMEKYAHLTSQAESHFEECVHKDLLRGDYRFEPQFPVGAYRLDIVLFTKDGKRIALECDGEKFHSTEEQIQNDLARQSVLERLGFTFVRIRGSDYYRRREETVEWLYRRLDELQVVKGNEVVSNNTFDISIDDELLRKAKEFKSVIKEKLDANE